MVDMSPEPKTPRERLRTLHQADDGFRVFQTSRENSRESAGGIRCEFGHYSKLPEFKPFGRIEPMICPVCAFGLVDWKSNSPADSEEL